MGCVVRAGGSRKVLLENRNRNAKAIPAGRAPEGEPPLCLEPVRGFRGSTPVPGDKSISHRALILGSLSTGVMKIRNVAPGEDVRSTRRCLEQLGVAIEGSGSELRLTGKAQGAWGEPDAVLDAGNSGTTI